MEPEARKPLAQQTFAFWEGEENPRDRRASAETQISAQTQTSAQTRASTETRAGAKTRATATSSTTTTQTAPTRQALTREAQGAEKRSVSKHLREKTAADETSRADSPSAGHEPHIAPQPLIGRESLMADLRSRAAAISSSPAMESAEQFSTGSPTVDTWLPGGGLKRGWICEWIAGHDASGASTLAMLAAASAIRPPHGEARDDHGARVEAFAHGGPIIVVDPAATFHASAAIACGIPAERIVVCRCPKRGDAVWTMDQALRCSSVAAVWATLPWNLNDRDARRLQLAAETGRTPGLLVLQPSARVRPSFATVRFHVASVAVDAARLSADQRVAAGLPVRPPLDLRVLRVNLDRARGQRQNEAFLAVSPEARLHTLSPAAVAQLQTPQHTQLPTPQRITQTQPGSRHEAVAVPLAARLADPASTHRNRANTNRANTDRRVG
ncbi:hypothetical protein RSSM_04227 [Rhodopirellula sallentina SM41]|uniref:Uncharacterized protein n=2 Tax=Rhodopirellula TaxID=265488 RepID=M5UEB7_9BACT|nr:hypothetical protein RSSM_04227 [Rhodopirellula sallentina SM41]